MQRASLRRAARRTNGGVLGPGDPDPPPGLAGDFYDYRGTATRHHVRDATGIFELGRFIDVRKGTLRDNIALDFDVLRRHAAILGPTGSGKTKSILLPWTASALRAGHSVVIVDISGDLLPDLAHLVNLTGPLNASVASWNYSDPSHSISWNWLAGLRDETAIVVAVEAIVGRERPNDPQPFFHQRDARLLRSVIELALAAPLAPSTADLLAVLRSQTALEALARAHPGHPALQRVGEFLQPNNHRYSEMTSGVINALELFDHPGVRQVTTQSLLRLDDILSRPSLLVIGSPLHGGKLSEVSAGLILSQIINLLLRRFGTSNPHHVFLMIDEAARLQTRLRLDELVSVGRRAGVSVVLATQDVGQFTDTNERISILGNCATYISLPGRSVANADYLASRLGSRQQSTVTLTRNPDGGRIQTVGTSTSYATQAVLGHREILDPPWGERCAVVHSQPVSSLPFLVDLTRSEWL